MYPIHRDYDGVINFNLLCAIKYFHGNLEKTIYHHGLSNKSCFQGFPPIFCVWQAQLFVYFLLTTAFFSDEDSTNISQRETIRRQLADNSDEDKEELTNHNLLLCFLNENPESDLEDYETSSPALSRSATKIPNNHPLACLKGKIVICF